jgi:hypothetical protein
MFPIYVLSTRFEKISKLDFKFKSLKSFFLEFSKVYKNLDQMVSILKEFKFKKKKKFFLNFKFF